ncbi:hypothetical protein [Jannaschia ovalis]|uniref:Uncharacterized protein n=1 Tax=Jannaschia ovalis TaxID=3038773 RepID=A0ABY8LCA6_9RHOB|nr:hypothetical protein [Jannaschia sp. GRR-S6-38]WGH78952.1 hypothetical protein P8627_01440 [Jannaschia sp. GRR-S6-38]
MSAGVQNTSEDIEDALTGIDVTSAFERLVASNDFTNGERGDWIGGVITEIEGFGEILALSGRSDMASLPIDVGTQHDYATVEFDMIMGDSWDNETGTISIAGQDVVVGTHSWREGEPDVRVIEGDNDTSVTLTRTSVGSGSFRTGGSSADYTYRVKVVAANDGRELTLGASTTLNSPTHDEFFGIDNVEVRGTNTP